MDRFFVLSGSTILVEQGKNTMVGGDVALVYIDEFQGHAEDFNLTARSLSLIVVSGLFPFKKRTILD